MTKFHEPNKFTRKQFEHTIWFLHLLHNDNIIDKPLLSISIAFAEATLQQGQEGTYGSLPNPPLPDTKPKRTYKKKVVEQQGQPTVSPCDPLPLTDTGAVKPKRTYKKKSVVAEVPSVGEVPKPKRTYKKKVVPDVPSVAEVPKPKRAYKKKSIVSTTDVPSVAEEPVRKGVAGVPTKSAIYAEGVRNLGSPCRGRKKNSPIVVVDPINDLIKNTLSQQQGDCLTAQSQDPPALCEEPLIIVYPAERKGVANLGSPCAGGGYSDSNNNIYSF